LISSGIYGYPKDEALKVATSAIQDFLQDHDMDVTLAVFDKSSFIISRELLGAVESYIDDHYVDSKKAKRRKVLETEWEALTRADEMKEEYKDAILRDSISLAPMIADRLEDLIGNLDEPFSRMLFRLIDAKGMTDVEVYKRANLDRKLFSKIRSNKSYVPSKRTVIALAVALKLNLDETDAFLKRAGYALSKAVKFDVIVEYFIANGIYDIFRINEVLFAYDQPLLGG
jgi:transcriptional regulator with XRE-family HTH domain